MLFIYYYKYILWIFLKICFISYSMNFSNYVFKTSLAKDLQILFEEQKEGW